MIGLPSDDERHDASFPHHPLSQVRARLRAIAGELALDAHDLGPYRYEPSASAA